MASSIPAISTDSYFFAPPWSRGNENLFFYYIGEEIVVGRWIRGSFQNNVDCLASIYRRIHSAPSLSPLRRLSPEDLTTKLRQWRRRFDIFTYLTSHPHVDYAFHSSNPPPRAINHLWTELSEVFLEVLYYRQLSEKNLPTLQSMFRALVHLYWGRDLTLILPAALPYVDPTLLECSNVEFVLSSSTVSSWPSIE